MIMRSTRAAVFRRLSVRASRSTISGIRSISPMRACSKISIPRRYVFDENVIRANASVESHEGRYNFTIGEIGHHVLHRDHYLAERDAEHPASCVARSLRSH